MMLVRTDLDARDELAPPAPISRGYGSTPFLSQPRAQNALRLQLTTIETALASELALCRARYPDSMFEMCVLPHRLIARLGSLGLSFSWVGAVGSERSTVGQGRLLVIEWNGVATETRGVAALRSARPVRERVYRPEGVDADHWRWRVDNSSANDGETYTTGALVDEWLARSSPACS